MKAVEKTRVALRKSLLTTILLFLGHSDRSRITGKTG
jgi:hypothetical protein